LTVAIKNEKIISKTGGFEMNTLIDIKPLLEKLNKQLSEIKETYKMLQKLKEVTGASFEIPNLSFNGLDTQVKESLFTENIIETIKPDQFYGKSNTVAAEEYLKMLHHSTSIENIYKVLIKGGIVFSGRDPQKSLYVSLVRAHKKFERVGKGKHTTFGLKEWYPDVTRKRTEEKTHTPITKEVEIEEKIEEVEEFEDNKEEESTL
jgi:hypothetical protein